MKTSVFRLFFLAALSVVFIFCLQMFGQVRLNRPNGFKRTFLTVVAVQQASVDLHFAGYYFNGKSDSSVFLANRNAPAMLLEANLYSLDTLYKYISNALALPCNWRSTSLYVEYPEFFLLDPVNNLMLSGTIQDSLRIAGFQPLPDGFYAARPLCSNSVIAVNYDTAYKQRDVVKYVSRAQLHSGRDPFLEKQSDGVFSTDGQLMAYPRSNVVTYAYYYRNKVLVADTGLSVKNTFQTIDTNNVSKISLGEIDHGKGVSFSSAPLIVNKATYVEEGRLYLLSNLRADNETPDDFASYSVLDEYQLSEGRYLGSVRIPNHNANRISDFLIAGSYLFALHGNELVKYMIDR